MIYIQTKTKKQFKVQIIGILEEIDSFYWPKMHLWKVDMSSQVPPHLDKRLATFFRETFPKTPPLYFITIVW